MNRSGTTWRTIRTSPWCADSWGSSRRFSALLRSSAMRAVRSESSAASSFLAPIASCSEGDLSCKKGLRGTACRYRELVTRQPRGSHYRPIEHFPPAFTGATSGIADFTQITERSYHREQEAWENGVDQRMPLHGCAAPDTPVPSHLRGRALRGCGRQAAPERDEAVRGVRVEHRGRCQRVPRQRPGLLRVRGSLRRKPSCSRLTQSYSNRNARTPTIITHQPKKER